LEVLMIATLMVAARNVKAEPTRKPRVKEKKPNERKRMTPPGADQPTLFD
jgi:hypothetical protein